MIISENYRKSHMDNKIYDTVVLSDIIELNNEKYFILSGYLFDYKETQQQTNLEEEYKNNTFFKRDISDEKSDIDAYYLIYNIDKNEFVKNKSQFIKENELFKKIRLDRTKCEQIEIAGEIAYKINASKSEYIFINIANETDSYMVMRNTKNGYYPEHTFEFNNEYNNVILDKNIKNLQEMSNMLEGNNINQLVKDSCKIFREVPIDKKIEEDNI